MQRKKGIKNGGFGHEFTLFNVNLPFRLYLSKLVNCKNSQLFLVTDNKVNYLGSQFTRISTVMHQPLPTSTVTRSRNDLWLRYVELGQIPGNAWRKDKIYQELKAANVEQRFTKTVIYQGYNLYGMHPALRDVLLANGLMTQTEWRCGQLTMSLPEWKVFITQFRMTVEPISSSALPTITTPPVATSRKRTSKKSDPTNTPVKGGWI